MKKVLFLVSVLFLFSITACDDNSRQGSVSCKLMKIAETSECLARSLNRQCTFFGCEGESVDVDIFPSNCEFTDCETLVCENMVIGNGIQVPGSLMDLAVDIESGFPIGLLVAEGFEEEVLCNFVIVSN